MKDIFIIIIAVIGMLMSIFTIVKGFKGINRCNELELKYKSLEEWNKL